MAPGSMLKAGAGGRPCSDPIEVRLFMTFEEDSERALAPHVFKEFQSQPLRSKALEVVKDGAVEREFRLQVPPRVYNFKDRAGKGKSRLKA